MLSVRNAILAALAIFALSLTAGVVSLLSPPDSNGAAVDSYGVRRDGFRAVFELLAAFQVPVERRTEPPSPDLSTSTTFVVWVPHNDLVANEPAYFERLLTWVEEGGRLVVAIPPVGRTLDLTMASKSSTLHFHDIWTVLKLTGIRSIPITLKDKDNRPKDPLNGPSVFDSRSARREQLRRSLEDAVGLRPIQFVAVSAIVTGSFANLHDRVRHLQVPGEDVGGLEINEDVEVAGEIECVRSEDESWTVAASFQRGQGEIIVVAEPMLLMNASISQADNSVLAYELLAAGGRRVVFDEFYHGLSVRGNPLWLLTKRSYVVVALAILTLLGLELWRRTIALGPPLDTAPMSRRTVIEYIEAMARFLNRGQRSRSFLLGEIRAGTIRIVGERFGLSPAIHDPEVIASSMAKRSPLEANQFRQAMRLLDAALAKGTSVSEFEAIRAVQRISHCL